MNHNSMENIPKRHALFHPLFLKSLITMEGSVSMTINVWGVIAKTRMEFVKASKRVEVVTIILNAMLV